MKIEIRIDTLKNNMTEEKQKCLVQNKKDNKWKWIQYYYKKAIKILLSF